VHWQSRRLTHHVSKVCRSSQTAGIDSKRLGLGLQLVADSVGAVHILIEARGVKVHIGESSKGAVQEELLGFIRDFPTSLSDGVRPLSDPNVEVELKILESRGFGIFATDSDSGASFIVLSLFALRGQSDYKNCLSQEPGNKTFLVEEKQQQLGRHERMPIVERGARWRQLILKIFGGRFESASQQL
jgi:hypothetical protein